MEAQNAQEPEVQVTTRSVGIRYGLISAVITIVLFLIPALMAQNPFKGLWNWIGIGVGIIIFVLAHKTFKDDGDGYMSMGQGVTIGFWMGLVSTLIGGTFVFLYLQFIDNSPFELMMEQNMEEMVKAGSPENAIEMANEWTRKLFWPIYLFFGIIGSIFFAFLISIVTKNNNPDMPV